MPPDGHLREVDPEAARPVDQYFTGALITTSHLEHQSRSRPLVDSHRQSSHARAFAWVHLTALYRRSITKMVNWNDPSVLFNDYLALIKLDHAIAGIYIWETVFTVGFELDVLRGKHPYRWTIWLYLGTRYTALLSFVLTLIGEDGGKVSCQVLVYASWAFASLIIVLRVIAIWNRQRFVSFLSVGAWLAGVATAIHSLTALKAFNNPYQGTCTVLGFHKSLSAGVVALVVDIVLLMSMLIGLLRYAHRSSTGIWYLLYQQCIIWIALASIAEVPAVVFLILNLNDAWNAMFIHSAIAILSLGAARLYRSLCQQGSLTEYMTSELPHFSPGRPISNAQYRAGNVHSSIHFVAATPSNNTVSTSDAPVFIQKDPVQLRFAPVASNPRLVHEKSEDKVGHDLETA
ncbi:hypothetical protein BJV78DRAFT_839789 [Lactifluus subvellereus]|nr:hypothetical protein BJV78DRAFT_839789 [Lactifluus subvellereus]